MNIGVLRAAPDPANHDVGSKAEADGAGGPGDLLGQEIHRPVPGQVGKNPQTDPKGHDAHEGEREPHASHPSNLERSLSNGVPIINPL